MMHHLNKYLYSEKSDHAPLSFKVIYGMRLEAKFCDPKMVFCMMLFNRYGAIQNKVLNFAFVTCAQFTICYFWVYECQHMVCTTLVIISSNK